MILHPPFTVQDRSSDMPRVCLQEPLCLLLLFQRLNNARTYQRQFVLGVWTLSA